VTQQALSFILFLCLALGPLKAATKDQLVEAIWAYGTGHYEEAVRSFEELATGGNAEAQMLLGRMYVTGEGVEADLEKGFYWLRSAALQDSEEALLRVASMLSEGRGISRDRNAAHMWLSHGANLRIPEAFSAKAILYLKEENYRSSFEWFRRGVDENDEASFVGLGFCYWFGFGVSPNEVMAFSWFTVVYQITGYKSYEILLSQLSSQLMPSQIETAKQRAHAWLQSHAVSAKKHLLPKVESPD
jgi:TPR repeat protein